MDASEDDDISEAAASVMAALQPLSPENRARVIQSMAALYGVKSASPGQQGHNPSSTGGNATHNQRGTSGNKQTSLVELIKDKQPATNIQRIACFAYYREKVEGIPNFSSADLSSYFAKAKLSAPGKNYMRDYNNTVKAAWIHDDGAQSYLTQEGENAVEEGFAGRGRPRGAASAKRKRRAAKE